MLHILMRSPFVCDLESLLRMMGDKDEILLLSDGVILCMNNSVLFKKVMGLKVVVYALENDIYTRGLLNYISEQICIINYRGFVKLTEKHSSSLSW